MAALAELTEGNAPGFLAGRIEVSGNVRARSLGGGVSNNVVLVEDGSLRIVLKQSIPRLRVRDEWLADRSRIFREWDAIEALGPVLPRGRLPELLFRDDARFLYAMRAASGQCRDWKTRLLAGECSSQAARLAGATLGLAIRGTWNREEFRGAFSDSTAFGQLRTDPYYRTVGSRHPELSGSVEAWIAQSARRKVALVHGDWSPKNLLVREGGLVCIDFECAHYGDPSYDAGFMLNHLILKAFRQPALSREYFRLARIALAWTLGMLPGEALGWFEAASLRHLAFLMLARIDGKSPVEYLTHDSVRERVRSLALHLIHRAPESLEATLGLAARYLPPARPLAATRSRLS